jgi:hypothetical protein
MVWQVLSRRVEASLPPGPIFAKSLAATAGEDRYSGGRATTTSSRSCPRCLSGKSLGRCCTVGRSRLARANTPPIGGGRAQSA